MQIPDDEGVSMQLLLGYIGLLNAVFLAPILIVLVSYDMNASPCLALLPLLITIRYTTAGLQGFLNLYMVICSLV